MLYSTLIPFTLLLSLSANATPVLEDRQGKVLAGAPISNITVTADNLVQCAESTISWNGAVVSYTFGILFRPRRLD
jgi:hypothetical protein